MSVSLVTGGGGFIGSRLVGALLGRGHKVRVLDNFSSGVPDNLAAVADKIELCVGELDDLDFVRRVTRGTEVVFHQASPTGPALQSPGAAEAPAVDLGALHVLMAAHEARVRRVIYASSLRVYGAAPPLPVEENGPLHPNNLYAVAKLAGEEACLTHASLYGLETVRLRYCNVYGPRQPAGTPYSGVIARVLEALVAGAHPVFDDDGLIPQDHIYVDDVVHANLLAAEAPRICGKAYNIAGPHPATARVVVASVEALTGARLAPEFGPPRPRGELDNLLNTFRAEVDLGFCASTDLARGLRQCVERFFPRRGKNKADRPLTLGAPFSRSPWQGPSRPG
jgi:UDP-glucose 4-epimerase